MAGKNEGYTVPDLQESLFHLGIRADLLVCPMLLAGAGLIEPIYKMLVDGAVEEIDDIVSVCELGSRSGFDKRS
jgi:hypothetical protein